MTVSLVLVSVARALLGVVLLAAGAAKLADRPGFQATLRALGAPERLVSPLSIAAPMLEVFVGTLVLTSTWVVVGDVLLLMLTGSFVAVSSIAVIRGNVCRVPLLWTTSAIDFSRRNGQKKPHSFSVLQAQSLPAISPSFIMRR